MSKKVAIASKGTFYLSNEISIAYIQANGYNDIQITPSETKGCSDYIEFTKDGVLELFDRFDGEPFYDYKSIDKFRSDPKLIKLIEEFKKSKINPCYDKEGRIKIVKIPNNVEFGIGESDMGGGEYVFECHRIWC